MSRIKYLLISLLVGFALQIQQATYAQKVKITESFSNQSLDQILSALSGKYNIKFAYDPVALNQISFTGQFRNDSPDKVLKQLLKDSGFEFIALNNVYVIKRAEKPIVEEKNKPIQGIVRDRISGEALPYASIRVVDNDLEATTNTDGFFTIPDVKSDSVSIEVRYLGFEPLQMRVARVQYNSKPIVVELDPKKFILADVEVVRNITSMLATGDRPGEMVFDTKKVGDIPGISGIDILAPLQLLPGVDGTTESLSGLMVRHSPADKNLISYDGFTIYHINHLFGAFSSLNSKAIKDVRLYRGGFDSRWGGRASSVIEITGKTGNENNVCVDAGTDQLAGDFTFEGPLGKHASFIVSARRSYTDFYRSPQFLNLFESVASDLMLSKQNFTAFGSDPDAPSYLFYDANAKVSVKPSNNDILSVSGYVGRDRLNFLQMVSSPFINENALWGNSGAGARWAKQWNSWLYQNFTVGISEFTSNYQHYDSTLKRRGIQPVYDTIVRNYATETGLNDLSVNLNAQVTLSNQIILELGYQSNLVNSKSSENYYHAVNSLPVADTLRQYDFNSRVNTGWLQFNFKTNGLKSLVIGGRVSQHNLTDQYYVEPRVQMVISPTSKLDLKFAAGLYNQFINRIYLTGNGVRYLWVASDEKTFPVVKSKHFVTGLNYTSNGLTLDIEGYAKQTEGLSYVQTVIRRTSTNRFVEQSKIFYVDSRSLGVDVLVRKTWQNAEGWVSYSLSKAFNQSSTLNGGDEYYALDDHLHELKLVGLYKWRKWRVVGTWIFGTPKPWDELLLTPSLTLSPDYEKNSSRLEPYHRLDAGLSYLAKVSVSGELEVGVKVFNLYNRDNMLARPYTLTDTPISDYLQGKSIIEYHDIYGYSITPTFFFNIKF
ncbi:MAG TPA: carboxypeptidase-like regulatory domain-containing protein [Tenuifilum sp.]|nr:carboxypeptidase-like regulatory domain-containing protein [Tenuifilum sp.]